MSNDEIERLKERVKELEPQLEEARLMLAISCNHGALLELRRDAQRYQQLVKLLGVTKLPCLLEQIVGDYVADGKESIDAAIDAIVTKHKQQSQEEPRHMWNGSPVPNYTITSAAIQKAKEDS